MFSFPPLINNSVAIGLSFLLLSISAIISSNTTNIFRLLFGLHSAIFLSISSISFEYSIKAFTLSLFFLFFELVSEILLHMELWHVKKFYQYTVSQLLDSVMHFFPRSRTSNYYYSVWMVRNLWPIWIMFIYVFFCI